ncbi:hypothetical protein Nepgr_013240 [Nepenthes gracilis]|uniref:F-box domain-containing protein n=1 Tax=Nepenthes gracilis TaxID=150966 RepID=A0AAD3XNY0_NEPGR|nr:hypothetical protein Nepgr_013240 [Nepenthes gracilis]
MAQCEGELLCFSCFYALPEGCIAAVISLTSPRDACRMAAVSRVFRSAADSDSVWEGFLPSDYQDIIARSEDGVPALLDSLSKKQLYHRLADRPLLIDGGTKSFWLDKLSGKKCCMIAARNLTIIWSNTPRYWKWTSMPESRFPEVAELISVCWLEIRGKLKTSSLSLGTNYVAYLIFKMTEDARGFYNSVDASLEIAGRRTEKRTVYLEPNKTRRRYQIMRRLPLRFGHNRRNLQPSPQLSIPREEEEEEDPHPKQRSDGWLEMKIGEFFTQKEDDAEVEMSMLETKALNWKGGLIVEGIEIRPKAISL